MEIQRRLVVEGKTIYLVVKKESVDMWGIGKGLQSFLYDMYVENVYSVKVILAGNRVEREIRRVFRLYEDKPEGFKLNKAVLGMVEEFRKGLKDSEVILGSRDGVIDYGDREEEEGYLFLDDYVFKGGKGRVGDLNGEVVVFNTERYWKVLDNVTGKTRVSDKIVIKK